MRGRLLAVIALAVSFAGPPGPAAAHDGVRHATPPEAAAHEAAGDEATPSLPFPIDLTARFDLVDQTGARRTERDFAGRAMAIFFGYANCEGICSTALPRLGAAIDILGEDGPDVVPVLITIDPERDTPEAMAASLAGIHPRFVGLTGSEPSLAATRRAFQVEAREVSYDADGNPIFAHGSFIYLIDGEGRLAALLPPILSPERMAEIMREHL